MPRLHLNLQNHNFTQVFDGWSSFRAGCAGPHQICILPHVWMSDLRNLCRGLPVPKRSSHSTTCLGVRNARSPQTVAAGKEVSHFTTPYVCQSDRRDLRRGLPKDKQDLHFATRLGARHATEGNVSQATGWLSLPPERNRRTGEVWFCKSSDTIYHLEVTWTPV